MLIVALLPPSQLGHLRASVGAYHDVTEAESWEELSSILRERVCDVLIADPNMSGEVGVSRLVELNKRFPSVPVILYTSVTPAAMQSVTRLSQHGFMQVVLYRYEDSATALLALLSRQRGDVLAENMLAILDVHLARVSVSTANAVRQLFREPHRFHTGSDLALAAQVTLRTVYRQLEQAGLASPRVLVLGARLLRGFAYLRDPGHSVEDVVRKLRFSSRQHFSNRMREMLGETADAARRRIPPQQFVTRLAARLTNPE